MKTNPREYRTATVTAAVLTPKTTHLEDMAERASELTGLISSGRAYLKVIAYPWGAEFDVCEREGPA